MSFLDRLRKKAEELDLETRAKQLQEAATQAAQQAREKAGEFTAEHREQIDGYVETAGAKIDEKTDHRYSDQIAKVTQQLERGVDLVADGYGPAAGNATGRAAAAGAATGTEDELFPTDPDSPAPVSASPLEPPAPIEPPTPVHASAPSAASVDEPVSSQDPSWAASGGQDEHEGGQAEQHAEQHADERAEERAEEPVDESLVDTALEDTVLGLDHPPVTAPHHDEPVPEDADEATIRSTRPHGETS